MKGRIERYIYIKPKSKEVITWPRHKTLSKAILKQAVVEKEQEMYSEMATMETMEDQPIFKIEDEIESEMHTNYYLKPSLRSSNIPKEVKRMIYNFGTIQHLSGDGNMLLQIHFTLRSS